MLLDHGHVILEGPPDEVVALHQDRSEQASIAREEELARKIAAVEGTQPKPVG
jgi:hypothetical protein